ncbi:unnamed protein product [Ciceribacter sp. T2.26MG-112.2]|nr:unnamed protein product [Ciceribacter naphthalenivorans]
MDGKAVDAVEAVGAEEVALRLDEVGGSASLAVGVEIGQRRRERRHRDPGHDGRGDDAAQRRQTFLHHGGEGRRDDQVGDVGLLGERLGDLVEELRTDDAAGAPDAGNGRHGERPGEFARGLGHHGKALRVSRDLGGKQRQFKVFQQGCTVGHGEGVARCAEDRLGRLTFGFHRRQAAGGDGGLNRGCRNAHLLRLDHRPLAGALLAGAVEDHVDQRHSGLRIGRGEHLFGDLDQVGIEPAGVPLAEDCADIAGRLAEPVAQDAVDLGDHLHVGIFDAVVDGLDEMPCPALAQPGAAWISFVAGGNRGEHLLDAGIGLPGAADHDRGTVPRALFATGNTHADEGQTGILEALEARDGVAEIGVAGIDDDVAAGQQRPQRIDLLVDRLAGLDHDDDRPRRTDGSDEGFDRLAADDIFRQRSGFGDEFRRARRRAVEHRDPAALLGDVERQVGAHHAKTDQSDFRKFRHVFLVACYR